MKVESGTVVVHEFVITSEALPSGATRSAFTDCADPWLKPWNVTVTPMTCPAVGGTLMVDGYVDAFPLPGRLIAVEFRYASTE
jgi:hypothetical protein